MDTAEMNFGDARRRRIYEYVEREGAVAPEEVRREVLVPVDSASKPARSGAELKPSVPMDPEEFTHHLSILKRDGYLAERDGKLRVGFRPGDDAVEVDAGGVSAVVRPARQEDITGIVGVIRSVADDDYLVAARLGAELDRSDVLLRHNESRARTFFVATVDRDAVGWLHLAAPQFDGVSHTAELTVGVLAEYRDRGIGTALMDRGLAWADRRGYRKVYQSLPASNERGIAFLEANGWSVEAVREGHYLVDGDFEDEVMLAAWLDGE